MADESKNFLALLNGIAKRSYYGEAEITDELLKSELFPNNSDDEFNALLTRANGIVKNCTDQANEVSYFLLAIANYNCNYVLILVTSGFLSTAFNSGVDVAKFLAFQRVHSRRDKSMVSADMDFNQSEAFLTSQMKKREGAITEDQANAFRKFWKTHKNKIHEAVISRTTWNTTIKQMSWRIDIKSQAKHIDQINIPTAIMELQIGPNDRPMQKSEVVRFEMDEEKLAGLLQNMQEIEVEVNKYCQQ